MKKKFKEFIQHNRWLKAVPNALTLCNSLCGFVAIVYTLQVYENPRDEIDVFAVSAWIIIFAMVFDALDGFAARLFNAASMHGVQMDSLSDMVTFGVAPATIAAIMTHCLRAEMTYWQNLMTYIFCGIYLGCAALRLATYNVHAILEKKSSEKFSGLPSPGGAAALCSVVLFFQRPPTELAHIHPGFIMPVYAALLGLLMVSNIPYPHMGKWFFSIRRNKKRLALFVLALAILFAFRIHGVVALVNLYILSGPAIALYQLLRPHFIRRRIAVE
ncbi:phosphatidylcholine/phosphatidylserine synthase [Victivallis sp. Marseille-Q1083]|uniref:CDP-alcohol phosphatidyltransferase family protein n=1 Tax=Victivallis sp. Marseille-Q1083 TaxID=2717288 RepID=UPI00158EB1B1|nr:CDP-alcohol phosphatidyltransferase family protein [Victivallis sp. Marseille-Q1083]